MKSTIDLRGFAAGKNPQVGLNVCSPLPHPILSILSATRPRIVQGGEHMRLTEAAATLPLPLYSFFLRR